MGQIELRVMTASDLPLGMRLKAQAGWNQTEADWLRFLALEPGGCFVGELAGEAAGTVVACAFGPVGWIAMLLVDGRHRGAGLGKALMAHALAYLEARGVASIRLDATPLGRPLYEKLGFAAEYGISRFAGHLWAGPGTQSVELLRPERLAEAASLDARIAATPRDRLLAGYASAYPQTMLAAWRGSRLAGFAGYRPGSAATHLGPCVAEDAVAGRSLMDALARRHHGSQVYVDVPEPNREAVAWAEAAGLRVQRPLLRMGRGPRVADRPELTWATSGPELG